MNPKTKSRYPQIAELHFGEPYFPHLLILHPQIQPTTDVKYLQRKFQKVT